MTDYLMQTDQAIWISEYTYTVKWLFGLGKIAFYLNKDSLSRL